MSHFSVLVIGADVEAQLAPFHEFECTGHDDQYVQTIDLLPEIRADYESDPMEYTTLAEFAAEWHGLKPLLGRLPDLTGEHKWGWMRTTPDGDVAEAVTRTNPNKKWDWWQVGGRYSGRLLHKNGQWVSSASISEVDFNGMRNAAEAKAADKYDRLHSIIAGRAVESWDTVRDAHPGAIDTARTIYAEQPVVQAIRAAGENEDWLRWLDFEDGGLGGYLIPRDAYLKAARDNALATFAVVKDGQWYERGEMGWFACVSNEKDRADWNGEFAKLIEVLAPDTLLTIVDCHI